MKYLLRAISALIALVTLGRWKYSRPVEGNALSMNLGEKAWWGYKFYGHPILRPEKNKGIREHFISHLPTDFAGEKLEEGEISNKLVISFAGDVLPLYDAREETTAHLFDEVADFLFSADIRYANLESPVAEAFPLSPVSEDITKPPELNNSPKAVALYTRDKGGFTIFSTANNHALDQGEEGLHSTLDFLDERGIAHVGTARSPQERDDFPLLEREGIKVAFLSWTFGLNGKTLPAGREYLANELRLNLPNIDISPIAQQAQQARERGADMVIACLHWGLETECYPVAHQIQTGKAIIEAGVDIIVGNHPHMLQPAQRHSYKDAAGTQREGLILYALGDLLDEFPQLGYSALAALARVELARTIGGEVLIRSAEFLPTYAYRQPAKKGPFTDIRILDFDKLAQRLQEEDFTSEPVLSPFHVKSATKLLGLRAELLPPSR
ncbi:MAG: CapA family protein [Coriobacteriales bacterium]|jgi:poly-gamma-glutamate synthesis protein (capsule biosynthesis protein)|nr:CapA family protein [Coriobacteriales bacterium]